jgi:gluconokinase
MPAAQAVIGLDIGTTGCRAVAYDLEGRQVASFSEEYPLLTPQAAWAEQDPELIYQAAMRVTQAASLETTRQGVAIAGLSLSSVMHSLMPVDADGRALANMLIWADSRSQAYAAQLIAHFGEEDLYQRSSCPVHPMYPLAKVLWFRHERPELFAKAVRFIGIKEYIGYRLFGKYLVDRSIATATAIYNLHTGTWDGDLLTFLGITPDQLSTVVPTTHVERDLRPETARRFGLDVRTPVVQGASDGVLSSLGAGTVDPGQITAMIGTSGAVRMICEGPRVDPKRRLWCYNLTEELWVLGGAISNGGVVFRWARDKFAAVEQQVAANLGLDTYEILSRYAEQKPPGSDGLIMLPYFSGERAPHYDADARGVIFGLNLNHGKRHLMRATLEGICYSMCSVLNALQEVAGEAREIRASGSFTRSRLWAQILADVFGKSIQVPGEPEGAAFGAAVLGMHALGHLANIRDVSKFVKIKETYHPIAENHAIYRELFAIYERLYGCLKQEFAAISDLQRRLAARKAAQ